MLAFAFRPITVAFLPSVGVPCPAHLKKARLRRLVDTSAMADARYTPSRAGWAARKRATQARDQALREACQQLKRERPGMAGAWYAQQIAKRDVAGGLSPETIRKKI